MNQRLRSKPTKVMTETQREEEQRCRDLDEEDAKAERLAEETERENDLWDAREGAHD